MTWIEVARRVVRGGAAAAAAMVLVMGAAGATGQAAKAPAVADAGRFEGFAGYSYERSPARLTEIPACHTGITCASTAYENTDPSGLNGFEASAMYKWKPGTGLLVDFSGDFGNISGDDAPAPATFHVLTFMAGPQWTLMRAGRFQPFGRVLLGAATATNGFVQGPLLPVVPGAPTAGLGTVVADTNLSLAVSIGGGVDMRLGPRYSLRLIQADYVLTHFLGVTQSQPRVSSGVVVRF